MPVTHGAPGKTLGTAAQPAPPSWGDRTGAMYIGPWQEYKLGAQVTEFNEFREETLGLLKFTS